MIPWSLPPQPPGPVAGPRNVLPRRPVEALGAAGELPRVRLVVAHVQRTVEAVRGHQIGDPETQTSKQVGLMVMVDKGCQWLWLTNG